MRLACGWGWIDRRLVAVAVVAWVAAISVTAVTGRFAEPERWEYSAIASHLLQGAGGYHDYLGTNYYFYGPPIYPMLLAGLLWLSERGEQLMLITQACAFAAACGIIYLVGRRWWGPTVGTVAGLLAALHPGNLIYAGKLHPQILDVCLIALAFLLITRLHPGASWWTCGMTGLVAGVAVVSRGPIAPFFILWAAWFVWMARAQRLQAIRAIAAVAIGAVAAVAPVIIQGYLRYGELVPLRTDTGINLWYGNHLGATGTGHTATSPPRSVKTQLPPALVTELAGMTEVEQHRRLVAESWAFMRQHPVLAVELFLKKFFYFWWSSPHTGLQYPGGWTVVYQVYYALVLALALVGFGRCVRWPQAGVRQGSWLLAMLVTSLSLVHAAFYVEGRHRWQVEPLLLLWTAIGSQPCVDWLVTLMGKRVAARKEP